MPRELPTDTPFLETARERFKLANDADSAQAQRERDDIAFENGDQWPADIKLARMGQQPISGMPAVPARPTLVINKVKEPVRQILNQERASDIGIELVPADDFGDLGLTPDDTEVTLREGLTRRIQRESIAADARTWAFKRAVIAGRGYYLVMTRYLPGKTNDQEIYVHRIYNQAAVLLDPAHEQPDGSDAEWGFVGTWVPWDRYKSEHEHVLNGDEYDENPYSDYGASDFIGLTESFPDWYKADGEDKAVRVVDYWYVDRESRELAEFDNGSVEWVDQLEVGPRTRGKKGQWKAGGPVAPKGKEILSTRWVVEKTIQFCKIGGGVQILERTQWAGPDMPIIKVLGDEVLPYDEQRRAEGMIRNARDAQMGFNYMISKQVEVIGLTPIPPLMVDPEAIEGSEPWYAVANTRTLPYLPHRTYNDQGLQLREPHRPAVDPNILPIAQSIGLFDATIKSTTAIPDPTLGNVDPNLKSGRAIREVVANAAQSTSNFMDNLARSVRYEGQVINNLLYPIYGSKPGRLVRTLTGEGESEMMLIGDPEQQNAEQMQRRKAKSVAKLTKDAHFNVIVKISKEMDSRRSAEATMIGELLSSDPNLMAVFGDLYLKNLDGPGHKQMAERMKVMLAPPVQALLAQQEKGEQPIPAQAQAQIAELTQRVQDGEAAMQELSKAAEGKQLDAQTKLQIETMRATVEEQKAKLEAQRDIELQRMKDATAIRVAEINAETKGVLTNHTLRHEADADSRSMAHDAALQADQQQHEREQAQSAMAHAAAIGDGQQQFDADEAELGRQATAAEAEASRQAAAEQGGEA